MDTAIKVLENKRMRFAVAGLFIATASGLGVAGMGSASSISNTFEPLASMGSPVMIATFASVCLTTVMEVISFFIQWIRNRISGITTGEMLRTFRTGKVCAICSVAACCGGFLGMGASLVAVALAGNTYGLIIASMSPIVAVITSRIFLKENVNARVIFGALVAIGGCLMTTFVPPSGDQYPHFAVGIVFALIACFAWGIEATIGAYSSDVIDMYPGCNMFRGFVSPVLLLFVITPILSVVCGLGAFGAFKFMFSLCTNPLLLTAILVGGVFDAIAQLGTYAAFDKTGGARTVVFVNTSIIWSIILGIVCNALGLYAYSISILGVAGVGVAFIGLALVAAKPSELLDLRNY